MGTRDIVCPSCGYDFPSEPDRALGRAGIAYSAWADVALMVGGVVAGLSCVGSVFYSLAMLIQGKFLLGLLVGPVAFFLNLAMLVVFLRIQKI
jgi:hypothetical protein